IHADDLEKANIFMWERRLLKGNEVKEAELKTRQNKWIRVRSKVFKRDEQGVALQIISFITDITEIKKAEQEIKKSRDLLQKIIDAPNVGIGVFKAVRDEKGQIEDFEVEFVNQQTQAALGGFNPVGKRIKNFGSDGIEQLSYFKEVIETKKNISYVRKAESGIVVGWYHFSNALLGNDRVVQIWEDITEIKKAELELKENRDFIKIITETIPDMVSVMEYPSQKILYINCTPFNLHGFNADDMINMTTEEKRQHFTHPDDVSALAHYYNSFVTMTDDDLSVVEYRAKNKTSEWGWFRARGKVFERTPDGTVKSILNVVQNITALK